MSDEEKQPTSAETSEESDEAPAAEPKVEKANTAEKATKPKKKKKSGLPALEDDSEEGRSLKEAETAFEIGDYQTARILATKLAGSSRAPIADRGRDLLRRTDVDPVQMIFLAACACALIGVAFYYLQ